MYHILYYTKVSLFWVQSYHQNSQINFSFLIKFSVSQKISTNFPTCILIRYFSVIWMLNIVYQSQFFKRPGLKAATLTIELHFNCILFSSLFSNLGIDREILIGKKCRVNIWTIQYIEILVSQKDEAAREKL